VTEPGCETRSDGFTILEVVVALLLLVTAASGAAGLVVVSEQAVQAARLQTSVTTLAVEKLEQLRSLAWVFVDGLPVSDTGTNLAVDPPGPGGGGLLGSPPGVLRQDTAGYVDYLDRFGAWVAGGATPPATAVFVRRWSIEPHDDDPADTLVLRVFVTTVARSRLTAGEEPRGRVPGEALMGTLVSRKTR
jgi:type II secretory pathway pseudopilin PulG